LKERVFPVFEKACSPRTSDSDRLILLITACDVFTQSEAACLGEMGFVDLIQKMTKMEEIVEMRVRSYLDPKTGKLDAPGFGNSEDRLRKDQQRRQDCLISAIKVWEKGN
jgi:hypothetical protein